MNLTGRQPFSQHFPSFSLLFPALWAHMLTFGKELAIIKASNGLQANVSWAKLNELLSVLGQRQRRAQSHSMRLVTAHVCHLNGLIFGLNANRGMVICLLMFLTDRVRGGNEL